MANAAQCIPLPYGRRMQTLHFHRLSFCLIFYAHEKYVGFKLGDRF